MNTKKITGTILLAAMLSGGGLAAAKVSHNKAVKALQTEQDWVLNNATADPTVASNYSPYTSGDIANACGGDENVCGIKAPANAMNQPQISNELRAEIEAGEQTQHVFLQPLP